MESARSLLPYFLHVYPFQPATGVWRSAEIAALLEHGLPEGVGLDVGCGDGLLTGIINERLEGSRTWVGIDPDPEEIALASETGLYSECIATGVEHCHFLMTVSILRYRTRFWSIFRFWIRF